MSRAASPHRAPAGTGSVRAGWPRTGPARTDPAPSRADGVVAAASEVIGGPLGRFAAEARRGWQPAAAILIALSSVLVSLGVLQKAHCLLKGWNDPGQYWHACYSDLPLLYGASGLAQGSIPYVPGGAQLDQPVVTGLAMWAVGLLVPSGASPLAQQQWYFALAAALVAVLLALLVLVTAATVPSAPWRAAHVALSPVLVTAGLISLDLLGVLLAAAGLWAWTRRAPVLAGLALGLAVMARTYPVLVIVAIGLVALRDDQLQRFGRLVVAALGTVLVVSVPLLVVSGWSAASASVLSPYAAWWRSGAGYGSVWLLPSIYGHGLSVRWVTVLAVLGWLAAVAVGALLVRDRAGRSWTATGRPGVAEAALVMIAIVLITGKAASLQSALWLLPFIALIGMRWRDHLVWAGVEVALFVATWLYAAQAFDANRALPAQVYALFVLARCAALAWLGCQARLGGSARDRVSWGRWRGQVSS